MLLGGAVFSSARSRYGNQSPAPPPMVLFFQPRLSSRSRRNETFHLPGRLNGPLTAPGFVGDVGASPPSSQPRRNVIKWEETASSSSSYLRSRSLPEGGEELVKVTRRRRFISVTFSPVMLFFTLVLFCQLKPGGELFLQHLPAPPPGSRSSSAC